MNRHLLAALSITAVTLAACGGDDDTTAESAAPEVSAPGTAPESQTTDVDATDVDTTDAGTTEPDGNAAGSTVPPAELDDDAPDLGRVVALAEEFILADLMALGVTPVASTASVEEAGFQGMEEWDTAGIEVLPQTTLNLEQLAALQPDTIVTLQFWVDQIGADVLGGIAELKVLPDGLTGVERLETLGELVGRPEHAAAVAADLAVAEQTARDRVGEDCTLSLAAIYPGPSVAAFVAGPWDLPSAVLAAGCELIPGDDAGPDANGRVWLSEEQLGMLDQELLVLLQNDTVEGEAEAVAAIEDNPLWPSLPAVVADNVVTFDRLGYAGATGLIRFYDEFSALLD